MYATQQRLHDLAQQIVDLTGPSSAANDNARGDFSIEELAGDHRHQLEVLHAARTERRILLMLARQSAKTWTALGASLDRATSRPNTNCLFLGLTSTAVRESVWVRVWKPMLKRFNVPHVNNETTMTTTFANGSRQLFSGTDDTRRIAGFLGSRYDGSVIVIDESQSQPTSVFKTLLTNTFPPMFTLTTTLMLIGTIPDVPGGPWWEESLKDSYYQRSWGRADNSHTPEAMDVLNQYLKDNHLDLTDSQVQRDWFGNRTAFDPNARAYFFRREFNVYTAETPAFAKDLSVPSGDFVCAVPLPGIDTFSGSIDSGKSDPCGVEVWGWDSTGKVKTVQQVFSWVSKPKHNHSTGEMFAVAGWANKHYPTLNWRHDGGGKQDITHHQHDYGLPVIKAADRADFGGRMDRHNDLLRNGTIKIIDDPRNPLLIDYTSAQLDQDALTRGQHKWRATYHPTASENGSYLLASYWPTAPKPPKPKPPADPMEAYLAKLAAEEKRRPKRTTLPINLKKRDSF